MTELTADERAELEALSEHPGRYYERPPSAALRALERRGLVQVSPAPTPLRRPARWGQRRAPHDRYRLTRAGAEHIGT